MTKLYKELQERLKTLNELRAAETDEHILEIYDNIEVDFNLEYIEKMKKNYS